MGVINTLVWLLRGRSQIIRTPTAGKFDASAAWGRLLDLRQKLMVGEPHDYPDRLRGGWETAFELIVLPSAGRISELLDGMKHQELPGRGELPIDHWREFLSIIALMPVDVIRLDVFQIRSRSVCAAWVVKMLGDIGLRPREDCKELADDLLAILNSVGSPSENADHTINQLVSRLADAYDRPRFLPD